MGMKKKIILQTLYIILIIAFFAVIWEFVLEEFLLLDMDEGIHEKKTDVSIAISISLLALIYPVYRGLKLISDWKALEKVFISHGLNFNEGTEKIISLESITHTLVAELNRRKKAENGIKSERENFFNMLDQLPISFHLQADNYTIPFANKMFRHRFGAPSKGMCYRVMHHRSEPCEPCPTFDVFDSHETQSSIWTSPDGKTYMTVVTPFENVEGAKLLMEMAVDITSEQKAKDDLKRVLAEQEEHIKVRTLELERSNASLKEFSSFAAHDLKEPLRKVMLFSERFRGVMTEDLEGKAHTYLDGMQNAVQRMDILIEDLLHLSQISTGGTCFIPVNLNDLVAEVIEDLEASFPGSRNNISVPNLPEVEADRTQMYQLFKNILSNCFKYGKAEVLSVVTIAVKIENNQPLQISIQDNGIGFNEKYKEKIFKPFERLHGRDQYSGTGIGLAICKKVVEIHEGKIDVQSQLDVGTRFTIRLPHSLLVS